MVTVATLLSICEILLHKEVENRHSRLQYSDGRL